MERHGGSLTAAQMMSSISLDLRRAETPGIDYLKRAREIAPMLAAASDEIEARRELPERVVEALIEGGFFRMLLPRSHLVCRPLARLRQKSHKKISW